MDRTKDFQFKVKTRQHTNFLSSKLLNKCEPPSKTAFLDPGDADHKQAMSLHSEFFIWEQKLHSTMGFEGLISIHKGTLNPICLKKQAKRPSGLHSDCAMVR